MMLQIVTVGMAIFLSLQVRGLTTVSMEYKNIDEEEQEISNRGKNHKESSGLEALPVSKDAADVNQEDETGTFLHFRPPLSSEPTKSAVDTCQFTFHFPRNLQHSDDLTSEISSLRQVLSSIENQMNNVVSIPTTASDEIFRTQNSANSHRRHPSRSHFTQRSSSIKLSPLSIHVREGPSRMFRRFQSSSEAAKTLRVMSEEMQVMMTNLEIQIDEADSRRRKLQLRNINLTRQLYHKINVITNMTQQNKMLEEKTETLQVSLSKLQQEKAVLQQNNQLLIAQKSSLEGDVQHLQNSLQRELSINRRIESEKLELQTQLDSVTADKTNYQENVHNMSEQVREMRSVVKRLQRDRSKRRCDHQSDALGFIKPKEEVVPIYTHCGILVNVSEPQTIRQSKKSILHRAGVWMKDPLAPRGSRNKIWTINQSGIKVRKLNQYSNMTAFQKHIPEVVYLLPISMESNGAAMYNGSLYFQRRNSRRIARYQLSSRKLIEDRSVHQAGFHGMFAYQWGGFTDIDFAVDETGLWVIYSTPRSRGNIVVSKINPENLRILKTVHTQIPKRKVANAFIICQVLYTVSGFRAPAVSINYSFNLQNRTTKKLNIPFLNNFQFNTMIDYNPADRYLYSWDNGRQVRYLASLDQSLGEIQKHSTTVTRTG